MPFSRKKRVCEMLLCIFPNELVAALECNRALAVRVVGFVIKKFVA